MIVSDVLVCVIVVFLGGVVTPIVLNLICEKKGWFK